METLNKMKYLGPIIFFLIFLSFGCQIPDPNTGSGATSQLNDGFVEELVELGTEVQEMAKPNKVRAWVSKLIVKAQPGKEMPQVGLMEEGEVAEYLYQRTVRKSEFSLRGQRFYQPWILIKTQSGVMGWVHEGGVSYLTPDYEQILNDLLNTKTNARQAAPKDPAVDRLIVPTSSLARSNSILLKASLSLYMAPQEWPEVKYPSPTTNGNPAQSFSHEPKMRSGLLGRMIHGRRSRLFT